MSSSFAQAPSPPFAVHSFRQRSCSPFHDKPQGGGALGGNGRFLPIIYFSVFPCPPLSPWPRLNL